MACTVGAGANEPRSLSAVAERIEHNGDGFGWWVVETANFRVLHRTDRVLARQAALTAESARAATYRKWFGQDAADWTLRCEVVLYENGIAYAQGTGVSMSLPGYTRVKHEGERVVCRRIDLNGDATELLSAVLPHEVNHAVMWSELGRAGLPRWAHEGMAVLSEPRARIDKHLRNLPAHYRGGELFSLSELILLQGYPERQRFGAFYAQSVSLVEFLASRSEPPTFIRFLRDCQRHGAEPALRQHYGASLAELEYQWAGYALEPRPAQTAAISLEP
jgi:hypothetical protein